MHNVVLSPIDPEKLISSISDRVTDNLLKVLLINQSDSPDQWFDLTELCQYIPDKPSKATVYGWVNAGTIPVHKGRKKLRFLKSEIDNWMKQGRRKTLSEIAGEAEQYLTKKKGGRNG
jgi:excisionase family DNA binding protein